MSSSKSYICAMLSIPLLLGLAVWNQEYSWLSEGKWTRSFGESSFGFFTISSCSNIGGHMGGRVVSRTHLVVSMHTPSCCIALNDLVLEQVFVVCWAVTTVSALSLDVLRYSLPQPCLSFCVFLANGIKARVARVHLLCCLSLLP